MDPQDPSGGQQQQRPPPIYDTKQGGHYGASATLSAQGFAPVPELYTGAWANVNQGLQGNYREILTTYWQQIIHHLENDNHDYKLHHLPLARIKKVMKADPDVKMISAEAPILFAKGCDIFITELTMRAWIHAEENKRRTLQRSDIASALSKSDMFDFLIDIVPREEAAQHTKRSGTGGHGSAAGGGGGAGSSSSGPTAAPAQAGAPPQQSQQPHHPQQAPQQQQQQQHPSMHPDYASLGSHGMGQEPPQDYRSQPAGIYGQPGAGPPGAYGQPGPGPGPPGGGMYGDLEGMYGYPPMGPQQIYQMPPQRGPDPHHPQQHHQQQQQQHHQQQHQQPPQQQQQSHHPHHQQQQQQSHHQHHQGDPAGGGAGGGGPGAGGGGGGAGGGGAHGHHYRGHHPDAGGEGDADAEGERDYEVG
ncbi:MAG: hypothetical protein M4579_003289 [Chaenotheca gracillima]|nr:MAG: hypothetical protein M4579_003289 [Chaenotheca gracillima]